MLHFNAHRSGNTRVIDRVTYLLPDGRATTVLPVGRGGGPPSGDPAGVALPPGDLVLPPGNSIPPPGDLVLFGSPRGGAAMAALPPGRVATDAAPQGPRLPRAGLPRTRLPYAGRRLRVSRTRIAIAVAAAVTAAGAGTAAYAIWSLRGSGIAGAGAANALNLRTTQLAVSMLYPGGTGDVRLTVANPNSFPVRISGIGFGPPAGIMPGTCTASDLALSGHPYPGPGVGLTGPTGHAGGAGDVVPARSSVTLVVTGAVSMGSGAAKRCAEARYTLPVSLTVTPAGGGTTGG